MYSHSESLKDGTYHSELLILTCLEPAIYLMAACFPMYRPLIRRILQFIPSRSFLGRFFKLDNGAIDLPVVNSKSSGMIRGRRAGVRIPAGTDDTFVDDGDDGDDGDQRGLVNCYQSEEGSAEVGSEEGFTGAGLNDSRIQVTSDITVERWTSSVASR